MNQYDDDRDPRRFERQEVAPKRDLFDRIIAAHDDALKAPATTVTSVEAIPPVAQTYVVRTYKVEPDKASREKGGFYAFVEMIDAEGRARFVLPPKVTAALYRQREALVKKSRSARGKARWEQLSPEQREASVTRLRGTKAG